MTKYIGVDGCKAGCFYISLFTWIHGDEKYLEI